MMNAASRLMSEVCSSGAEALVADMSGLSGAVESGLVDTAAAASSESVSLPLDRELVDVRLEEARLLADILALHVEQLTEKNYDDAHKSRVVRAVERFTAADADDWDELQAEWNESVAQMPDTIARLLLECHSHMPSKQRSTLQQQRADTCHLLGRLLRLVCDLRMQQARQELDHSSSSQQTTTTTTTTVHNNLSTSLDLTKWSSSHGGSSSSSSGSHRHAHQESIADHSEWIGKLKVKCGIVAAPKASTKDPLPPETIEFEAANGVFLTLKRLFDPNEPQPQPLHNQHHHHPQVQKSISEKHFLLSGLRLINHSNCTK